MSILDPGSSSAPNQPPDNMALIKMLGEKFIVRKDVKAVQHGNGAWTPGQEYNPATGKHDGARLPFTLQDFNDHLAGKQSLGHYMIGTDDTCKLFAFDIDLTKTGSYLLMEEESIMDGSQPCNPREVWLDESHPGHKWMRIQLRCMAEGLAIRTHNMTGLPVAVMNSGGKGLHVYCFTGVMPAVAVRSLAHQVLDWLDIFEPSKGDNFFRHKWGKYENIEIEVFPKQDSLDGKDLGNLMRLPLGINQKTKKRAEFITLKNGYDQPWLTMDPMRALSGDLPWE